MQEIIQNKLLYPEILWERPVHYYKAEGGKILVIAGSKGMTAAAILTCEAIFRSGTGVLVLGFPDKLKDIYKEILPEAMTLTLPSTPSISLAKKAEDAILEQSKTCDVAVIGPGLSTNAETIHLIWQLIFELAIPIVLDADGLMAMAKGIEVMREKENEDFLIDFFQKLKAPLVITPQPGEAARIINAAKFSELKKTNAEYVEQHKKDVASLISKKLGIYTVIKGNDTVIAEPHGNVIINKIGEFQTAVGSGDVLSGIIGSFIGQNPDKILKAIPTAVYLHGMSGKIAKENIGERSVVASDIIRYLPQAIKISENN